MESNLGNTHEFIWSDFQAKQFFQCHKLWPSFVGVKLNEDSKGSLPILVWPEQTSQADKCSKHARIQSAKRKRESYEIQEENSDAAIAIEGKRRRLWDLQGGMSMLGTIFSTVIEWGKSFLWNRPKPQSPKPLQQVASHKNQQTPGVVADLNDPQTIRNIVFKDLHDLTCLCYLWSMRSMRTRRLTMR